MTGALGYNPPMRFQLQPGARRATTAGTGATRVLRAAKRLFVRSSGSGFSARGVAKEAGLSLGAVQHFFPTRAALLAATLESVVNEYEAAYAAIFAKLPLDGEARLLRVIDWLIDDSWRPRTRSSSSASGRSSSTTAMPRACWTRLMRTIAPTSPRSSRRRGPLSATPAVARWRCRSRR
jgi:AcrR family transcriptional regulator